MGTSTKRSHFPEECIP